jgi:hypothetical protein
MTGPRLSFNVPGLREAGFEGFESVATLRRTRLGTVPNESGVYAIVRDCRLEPQFLAASTGGWFKGLNPSDPIHVLESKWVKDATVVYIGKAGSETGAATLRSRLKQLLDYGAGRPVGHRGGRFLWHLADSVDLIVCWRPSTHPRYEEAQLLTEFRQQHRGLPFANLIG